MPAGRAVLLLDLHRRLRHRRSAGHDDRHARQRLRRRLDDVDRTSRRCRRARRRSPASPTASCSASRRPAAASATPPTSAAADVDEVNAVAVDAARNMYIAGTTRSANFPLLNADPGLSAVSLDGFVGTVRSPTARSTYSTYHGGNGVDTLEGIGVDAAGNVNTVGSTSSTNLPVLNAARPTYERSRRRVPLALRADRHAAVLLLLRRLAQRRRPGRRGPAGRLGVHRRQHDLARLPGRLGPSSRPSAASSMPSCWRSRRPAPSRGRPTTAARAASAAARWR